MALDLVNSGSSSTFQLISDLCSAQASVCDSSGQQISQLRSLAYGILLNKTNPGLSESLWGDSIEELLVETLSSIKCHNRKHWSNHIELTVISKINRLEVLLAENPNLLDPVKSLLTIILLVHKNSLPKKNYGIRKYLDHPIFFPSFGDFKNDWRLELKESFPFSLELLERDNLYKSPDIYPVWNRFYSSDPSPLKNPFGKSNLNQITPWETKMKFLCKGEETGRTLQRPLSQTVTDEGFVTPGDLDGERSSPFTKDGEHWCDWEVVKVGPPSYYTWEGRWANVARSSLREKWNPVTWAEHSYIVWAENRLLGRNPVPLPSHLLTLNQFKQDLLYLLLSSPSPTFLTKNDTFELARGVHVKGIQSYDVKIMCNFFIQCATVYGKLEKILSQYQKQDNVIPQVFYQVVRSYLVQYQGVLIELFGNNISLNAMRTHLPSHLESMLFILGLIEKKDDGTSWPNLIYEIYMKMPFVTNINLFNLLSDMFVKFCSTYLHLFERLIRSGESCEALRCSSSGEKSGKFISINQVPAFLHGIAYTIIGSSRTLYLLHKDREMRLRKTRIEKMSVAPSQPVQYQSYLKDHLNKFLREKEEENRLLNERKKAELSRIMNDINLRKQWKEAERLKLEEEDNKIEMRDKRIEERETDYLEKQKIAMEKKYEAISRASEKQMDTAKWKIKRLSVTDSRKNVITDEIIQEEMVKKRFQELGLNIQGIKNKVQQYPSEELAVSPCYEPESEVDGLNLELINRSKEAKEIKIRVLGSSIILRNEETKENINLKESLINDPVYLMNEFTENRNKALATKKKVMSTELGTPITFEKEVGGGYHGVSEQEKKDFEKILEEVVIATDDSLKNDASSFLYSKKKEVIKTESSEARSLSVANVIEMRTNLIKDIGDKVREGLGKAQGAALAMLRDDFVAEASWLRTYFLMGDGVWGRRLATTLVQLTGKPTPHTHQCTQLLPDGLSILAPTDKFIYSPLEWFSLAHSPPWPLSTFFTDDIINRYNSLFKFLMRLEFASCLLDQTSQALRSMSRVSPGPQLSKLQIFRHIMAHFVNNLKSVVFGWVEKYWNDFLSGCMKAASIDELHRLHRSYLKQVLNLCLEKSKSLLTCYKRVFDSICKFCEILKFNEFPSAGKQDNNPHFGRLEHTFNAFFSRACYFSENLRRLVKLGHTKPYDFFIQMIDLNSFYIPH